MCIKLGIPRSLFYYKFYSLWETFFSELGIEVIFSEHTNRRILDAGVKACVDEACLPIKLFHGHVINLKDRVDYLFIPRFTSISKREYICPEFGGLPDMVRHTVKGLPPIIDEEINMRSSGSGAVKAAIRTGAILGAARRTVKAALRKALEKQNRKQEIEQDIERLTSCPPAPSASPLLRIAVIGHVYNVYDRYVSMDLLSKLKGLGAEAITIEMVDVCDINKQASCLSKPMFWHYGRNAYGAALHLAESGAVDGIICVTSFGCGIDSFVHDLIERKVRREYNIPFITVTIDEHTGEAGFNTRLEAFIDMLQWRKPYEDNISASG